MTISALPIACVYSTHCTKYILFPIKISMNGNYILEFPVCHGPGPKSAAGQERNGLMY